MKKRIEVVAGIVMLRDEILCVQRGKNLQSWQFN
tara:strand:+ start:1233 stop:1334 length:102 start_codon:yes stop_codon:yes gene_type:complete